MNSEAAYSRPQKSADRLGALAHDRHRFLQKRVLLTGDHETLTAENGRNAFLYSLRLLVRICPNLTVSLPVESEVLLHDAEQLSREISFGKPVEFVSANSQIGKFDAILSVGPLIRPDLPWTAINCNGWVCRVSSGSIPLAPECGISNPIGALASACLGVGEVFKRLIALDPGRGQLLDGVTFSLRTYTRDSRDYGPELPEAIETDLLLVGAGAIGNGIVALLSQLPMRGNIHIIDRERFAEENLGTCLLIGPEDIGHPKTEVLGRLLRSNGKAAKGFEGTFEMYAVGLNGRYPALVLDGLDNIDVRHEVQRSLWPDLIIDGAIGDFGCQVSRHPWAEDVACLLCLFRKPARSAESEAMEATGLSQSRVVQINAVVTSDDIAAAPDHRKEYLRLRLGKPICSVVSEAVIQKISQEKQTRGFEPSVPFVASFSACMVVAEAIAYVAGWPSALEPRFQFDFLRGPTCGEFYPQSRRADCLCARRKNIEKMRAAHGLGS